MEAGSDIRCLGSLSETIDGKLISVQRAGSGSEMGGYRRVGRDEFTAVGERVRGERDDQRADGAPARDANGRTRCSRKAGSTRSLWMRCWPR